MKGTNFNELSREELNEKILDLKKQLFNLRFQMAINSLQDTSSVAKTKRDIALAKTALRNLELKAQA